MKIAVDLTRLNRHISGMERYAMMITYSMVKQSEDEFILLFRSEIHPLFNEFKSENRVKMLVAKSSSNLIFDLFILPYKMALIRADRYLFPAFPVPLFFFKRNTISVIHDLGCWDCPDTMIHKFEIYFKIALRLSCLKCKKIITVSEFTKQRVIEKLKYRQENIRVVYNGVSDSFLNHEFTEEETEKVKKKYHLPDDYFLCLSQIQPRKNMNLLLNACKELWEEGKTDTALVLAGENGWKNSDIFSDAGDKVTFTGYVEDEDLPSLYHMAKAFVFPSIYEGFGIPPIEAMASETIVLSSNAPCMPEILLDAALYFENNSLKDLKEKLCLLDTINRNEKIKKGYAQARKYSWEKEAEKLLGVLKNE